MLRHGEVLGRSRGSLQHRKRKIPGGLTDCHDAKTQVVVTNAEKTAIHFLHPRCGVPAEYQNGRPHNKFEPATANFTPKCCSTL